MRTIEVLVDRDAVTSGAAAQGTAWQYYDLGHGWCTYTFFEQCPHRMACAHCDFYAPKASTKGQLLTRLADVPTPAGPTPRDLGIPATATRLPIISTTTVSEDQAGPW
jgi:hypothetical protein